MDLNSVYSEIKQFLSISDECFDLEQNINYHFRVEPDENKLEIVGDILSFVNKFSLFRDIKPFMNSLYTCINNTLEIKPESVLDFEELLIKNSIMHFVHEYINYSKINQKDQVLQYLTDSLEKLQAKPLIINLGLLLKPMYNDQNYLNNLKNIKGVEVTYNIFDDSEIQIKNEIDNWLKSQKISLDNQEELKIQLKKELERLFMKYNLSKDSDKSNNLQLEVMEMLTLKLTMLSLMEQIPDDSFEPIPIK
ncbi:hypothetical protein LCGC14_3005190 [marine sediment metagenome]|uniref:Uncharacterized protein n=1 Tax=marine sediment metagenome TaxID=412755 RepID=A0A0F8X0E5_9ZZZZ